MTNDTWIGEARTWIEGIVGPHTFELVRDKPWSTVYRVTTDRVMHFKSVAAGGRFEPALVAELADWPHCVPSLIAVDVDRAWMLMGDDGTDLWQEPDEDRHMSFFERLLPEYARMQHATLDRVGHFLALGVPDYRVERIPALLTQVLAGDGMDGVPMPMTAEVLATVPPLLPLVTSVCDELTDAPSALDHADAHSGNILVRGDEGRLVDWGDACVTHPFNVLFAIFETAMPHIASDRTARALRLRDAYLDVWPSGREHLAKVMWLGQAIRALTHVQVFIGIPDGDAGEWAGYVAELLVPMAERAAFLDDEDAMIDAIVHSPKPPR